MAARSWFIASGGKSEGPYLDEQLRDLIGKGVVVADTLVWSDGMAAWQRAGDVGGLIAAGAPPPPQPPVPLPGAFPGNERARSLGSAALSADFGVWEFLGRGLLLFIGIILVIPAPWVVTSFYKWFLEHLRVPQRPDLSFTGKPGDIWYILMLSALSAYTGLLHVRYLPFLMIFVTVLLNWLTLRWAVSNISSQGQHLPLRFAGDYWPFLGWIVFVEVAFISIIGWAWVETATMRWVCRNIQGTNRAISFTATGWGMLWRTFAFAFASIFIIPIPWVVHWYVRWFVSQISLGARVA